MSYAQLAATTHACTTTPAHRHTGCRLSATVPDQRQRAATATVYALPAHPDPDATTYAMRRAQCPNGETVYARTTSHPVWTTAHRSARPFMRHRTPGSSPRPSPAAEASEQGEWTAETRPFMRSRTAISRPATTHARRKGRHAQSAPSSRRKTPALLRDCLCGRPSVAHQLVDGHAATDYAWTTTRIDLRKHDPRPIMRGQLDSDLQGRNPACHRDFLCGMPP